MHLAGARGLRRYEGEQAQALRPRVLDHVIDARRHDNRVERDEVLHLRANSQTRLPFEHDVEVVGGTVAATRLLLQRLQADQVADQAWPVEEVDVDRAVLEKTLRLTEVDDFHSGALPAGRLRCP